MFDKNQIKQQLQQEQEQQQQLQQQQSTTTPQTPQQQQPQQQQSIDSQQIDIQQKPLNNDNQQTNDNTNNNASTTSTSNNEIDKITVEIKSEKDDVKQLMSSPVFGATGSSASAFDSIVIVDSNVIDIQQIHNDSNLNETSQQNSPTNRSLFKISEESIDQSIVNQDKINSQQQQTLPQTTNDEFISLTQIPQQISFSTVIANGPSFQDTTVSDTKLFNFGEHNKQDARERDIRKLKLQLADGSKQSHSNENNKRKRIKYTEVRRANSDVTQKHTRQQSNNAQQSSEHDCLLKRPTTSKRRSKRRSNSFNSLFRTGSGSTDGAKSPSECLKMLGDDGSGSGTTGNVNVASGGGNGGSGGTDGGTSSQYSSSGDLASPKVMIDDIKFDYLKNKQHQIKQIRQELHEKNQQQQDNDNYTDAFETLFNNKREEYEKQGAIPRSKLSFKQQDDDYDEDDDDDDDQPQQQRSGSSKVRPKTINRRRLAGRKEHKQLSDEQSQQTKTSKPHSNSITYDHNDTSEGTVHYFIDSADGCVYKYSFAKNSSGIPEKVSKTDPDFNINDIPAEFRHCFDAGIGDSGISGNADDDDSGGGGGTIGALVTFRPIPAPPPLPPPPRPPLPSTRYSTQQQPSFHLDLVRIYEDMKEAEAAHTSASRRSHSRSTGTDLLRSLIRNTGPRFYRHTGTSSNSSGAVTRHKYDKDGELNVTETGNDYDEDDDDSDYLNSDDDWDDISGAAATAGTSTTTRTNANTNSNNRTTQNEFEIINLNRLQSNISNTQSEHSPSNIRRLTLKRRKLNTSTYGSTNKEKTKYKLEITKKFSIRIPFDRFSLVAMLDRNNNIIELLFTILLACLVSAFGSLIICLDIFQDIYLIIFCFIIASCHYSLLKSAQPDSASPIHGFNSIITLSRSIYFCIVSSLLLICYYLIYKLDNQQRDDMYVYLNSLFSLLYEFKFKLVFIDYLFDFFQCILLLQPLLFTIGLYPQINTFLLSFIEQIDVYLFGGTAMYNLASSVYSLIRSLTSLVILTAVLCVGINASAYGNGSGSGVDGTNNNNPALYASNNKHSQSILFSIYCALLIVVSYLLSRQSSDINAIYSLIRNCFLSIKKRFKNNANNEQQQPSQDEIIEKKIVNTLKSRYESDFIVSIFIFIFVFAIHVSTLFTTLRPYYLNDIFYVLAIICGFFNHYLLPQLRVEHPWHLFNKPILKPEHWSKFEPDSLAKLTWFERIHTCLYFLEKNFFNILLLLSTITMSIDKILFKLHEIDPNGIVASLLISVFAMKLVRFSYCEPAKQYHLFIIAYLFNKFDINSNYLLIDMFLISIVISKLYDFLDKIQFIYVYTAPWQLPWGSAIHAFAQPLSLPHSGFLFIQIVLSTLVGAPLMPVMGSAFFLLSYMRPIKFWDKNYNTNRVDNTNTRLQTQFDGTMVDSENLNAIFYEHLTSVLQQSLCGDVILGRWGIVHSGDFFVLSSDYLNCLVHVIEIGNGFLTFQLRGLEFKGTYCQQRELEAITEDNTDNEGCCCCKPGHIKCMLSFNAAFNSRWFAWRVIARKYIVDAYRIVDNDLSLIVNFYSLRRTLIDFYVKASIYYTIINDKLNDWLTNQNIINELSKINDIDKYADYDTCFDSNLDSDYDTHVKAVTYSKFCSAYLKWIVYCEQKRHEKVANSSTPQNTNNSNQQIEVKTPQTRTNNETEINAESFLTKYCFALSLVCRRALLSACTGGTNLNMTNQSSNHPDPESLQSFQYGYYTLFKGDIRIQSSKDEWVFNDMDILKNVIVRAVRMALRLHQDHFQFDQTDEQTLYDNLIKYDNESVISYERDPQWRHAVLNNVPSLLSLRHHLSEFSDQYKVVMLNKNYLSFRVIKVNKECVRSFWAGQQHELIFLRNKNTERGSIQNAKQVLRNIINSSCDQPIGYPIYVSPLTTSYSSTHKQISKIIGPEYSFIGIFQFFKNCFTRIHDHCLNNCSGSSNNENNEQQQQPQQQQQPVNVSYTSKTDSCQINVTNQNEQQQQSQTTQPIAQRRTSIASDLPIDSTNSIKKSNATTLMSSISAGAAGSLKAIRSNSKDSTQSAKSNKTQTIEKAIILDIHQIVDISVLNSLPIEMPDQITKEMCCKKAWNGWSPHNFMEGIIVKKWSLSETNNTIKMCLIKIADKYYVPVNESGVRYSIESTNL